MRFQTPYDENYRTCSYTHAWLRVMHEALEPTEVSELLGIQPSSVQRRGDLEGGKSKRPLTKGGWFLSTEGVLFSKDARHHLDWIIAKICQKAEAFAILHQRHYRIDLCVRWDSKSGHGGPTVSPDQMKALSDLEIELFFDVYVGELD